MAQVTTSGAMSSEPAPAAEEPPPSWFVYEGPKISFSATIGASKEMTLLGFQAVTKIGHNQSISWGTLSADVNGPLYAEIEIKGPKKTIKMNLGMSLEVAPGALIRRVQARLAARGVDVQATVGQQVDDVNDNSVQPVEIQTDGTKNQTGPDANANVQTTEV